MFFSFMVPLYATMVKRGTYVLFAEDAKNGQKVIPDQYLEAVIEYLIEKYGGVD